MKNLKPLNDRILFTFLDTTIGNIFQQKSRLGIYIVEEKHKQVNKPRWGKVENVGKDVSKNIYPGLYILVDSLKWTNNLEYRGFKFWNTKEDFILAISEEVPSEISQ